MAERSLRDLGMRGDIIKTMHRAFTERGGKLGALPTMPSRVDNRRPRLSDGSSTEDCTTN
ncbi:hypothetical protein ACVWW4_006853 [Bradyrhizobium sp. LB7.1]